MRRRLIVLLLIAGVLVVASACSKPKAGGACKEDTRYEFNNRVCADPRTMLVCEKNTWVAGPCRGPKGCYKDGTAECDFSGNEEGDHCFKVGYVGCGRDTHTQLRCDGKNTVHLEKCKGPEGCARGQCDQSVGDLGDHCANIGGQACSVDLRSLLSCSKDHVLVAGRTCLGPCRAHTLVADTVGCDLPPITIGAYCDPSEQTYVCLNDAVLQCTGTWIVRQECGKDRCNVDTSLGRKRIGCGQAYEWGLVH